MNEDCRRKPPMRHGSARPQDAEDACRTNCSLLPKLSEICADESEVLAITIARFIASGYMTTDVACWDAAHDCAERLLGPVQGARMVASIAVVIRALRREREEDWRFMPANCCRLTKDEQDLVRVLALARRERQDLLWQQAAQLARRIHPPLLIAAVEAAAETMTSAQDVLGVVNAEGLRLITIERWRTH